MIEPGEFWRLFHVLKDYQVSLKTRLEYMKKRTDAVYDKAKQTNTTKEDMVEYLNDIINSKFELEFTDLEKTLYESLVESLRDPGLGAFVYIPDEYGNLIPQVVTSKSELLAKMRKTKIMFLNLRKDKQNDE